MIDCVFQNTYVWLTTGEGFWFYPTRVEYEGVNGYRWNGVFWMYYGIDPRFIDAVSCYPTLPFIKSKTSLWKIKNHKAFLLHRIQEHGKILMHTELI
jgi:hypothetical protein